MIWLKKSFDVGMYSNIYRLISFKLGMMIENSKIYSLISVRLTFTFILGHSTIRNQKMLCRFSQKFAVGLDEIQYSAKTCWFVEADAKFILHK